MRILVDEHGLAWDEAWDADPARVRLHEPHGAARGARALAGGPARGGCCPATSRSSRRSTAASALTVRALPGADDGAGAAHGRSSTSDGAACAWRTSRSWAATPSTAWPRCTRGSCARRTFADLDRVLPGRINNKTNGITPRRWLLQATRPGRADHRGDRRRLDHATSTSCAGWRRCADDAAFRAASGRP